MSKLDKFANLVYDANEIAGDFDTESYSEERWQLQVKLIQEELNEFKEALDIKDNVNALKEWTDLMVVVFSLGMLLENRGYDCAGALLETAKNNLTKFPTNSVEADLSVEEYTKKGVKVSAEYNGRLKCFVIRDENGKYRKPVGYKKADVSEFVPTDGLGL